MAPKRPTKDSKPAKAEPGTAPDPDTAWKPPRTQKTELERSISRVGAIVPAALHHDWDDSMERHERLVSGGPSGPPVLDRLGYKMNRSLVIKSSYARRPRRKKGWLEELEREAAENNRINEIMGVPSGKVSAAILAIFPDQVACDLDIPYHTVELPEYEEWSRRGFKFPPERWQVKQSEEESARILALQVGSAFRE
ncbi:uncharacterized protein DNG_09380 [Cephalotrichum gorgonifer]|uniref:Uncharacterized protein n=1 Tax=Cephalotrichum gorgonifer TaxID=2041049 RepID=A0AAE8SZC5_9PEZI|nr:uncharacterized protein DNG_09380 [Cephalotrichum gorgonifer]